MISKKVLYKCAVSELLWTYLNLVLTTGTFSNVLLDSVLYNHRRDKNTRTDMNSFTVVVI